jgi:hypothetical protein
VGEYLSPYILIAESSMYYRVLANALAMPATGQIDVKRITDGRRIVLLLLSRITNVQNQSRAGIDRRRR